MLASIIEHFKLPLLIVWVLILLVASVDNRLPGFQANDRVDAQTPEELCESTGGSWVVVGPDRGSGPEFGCVCIPPLIFQSSTGCVDPLEFICESTGGSWVVVGPDRGSGPEFGCSCPPGLNFISSEGCVDTVQFLCESTGGSWVVVGPDRGSGPEFGCSCPAPNVLQGNQCVDPNNPDGPGGMCDTNVTPECDPGGMFGSGAGGPVMCEDGQLGVDVSPSTDPSGCIPFNEEGSLEQNPIFVILGNVVQFLLASVGVGLVAVVILSGYQYMAARGNPQQTAKARDRIGFAIVGIVMFAIASVLMNWLIPGGVI